MTKYSNREHDREVKARQNAAGKFGFILGCLAAVVAMGLNIWRSPRPLTFMSIALAALMAALNIPLGIALGLLGERVSRPKRPEK